jgi:hypothetical protein
MKSLKLPLFLILVFFGSWSLAASPPPLKGKDVLTGKSLSFEPRNLVVAFLSARCPCSNSHMPELADLAASYKNFKFVGVHSNLNENPDETKEYFTSHDLPFPVIQDQKLQLADRFKALKTPHVFVFGGQGELLYQGGVSSSADFEKAKTKYLRNALEDIENHRAVRTAEARTLGCAISRR